MQQWVIRPQTDVRSHFTAWHFPPWQAALSTRILSYYENVCQVRLESSLLRKWLFGKTCISMGQQLIC